MNPRLFLWAAIALAMFLVSTLIWNPARAANVAEPNYWAAVRNCIDAGTPEMICHMQLSRNEFSAVIWSKISTEQCVATATPRTVFNSCLHHQPLGNQMTRLAFAFMLALAVLVGAVTAAKARS